MKEIPLSQGKIALIDDEDYELVNQFKWYAQIIGDSWIACRSHHEYYGSRQCMHTLITGYKEVDHKNGKRWDNRRENLREATRYENTANRPKFKGAYTSNYKGVSKRGVRWQATIIARYQRYHLGVFDTEIEAAEAYNKAAIEHHGEFARLNIVEE